MGVECGFDIVVDFDGTVVTHDFPRVGRGVKEVYKGYRFQYKTISL